MEDDLRWKTAFDGRRPLMEDDLGWKMSFDERQPLMEDKLWRKTTFDGRWPLTEDSLWQKTPFDGRRPLIDALPKTSCTFPKPTLRWTQNEHLNAMVSMQNWFIKRATQGRDIWEKTKWGCGLVLRAMFKIFLQISRHRVVRFLNQSFHWNHGIETVVFSTIIGTNGVFKYPKKIPRASKLPQKP